MAKKSNAQAKQTETEAPSQGQTQVPSNVEGGTNPIVKDGYDIEKLYEEHKNHSSVMRFLGNKGYETKHIATFLGKRYQHVRNVLNQPLKGQPAVAPTTPKSEKGRNKTEETTAA